MVTRRSLGKKKRPEETNVGNGEQRTRGEQQDDETAEKYHVALSFAGEDRAYVEMVAARLQHAGVRVFYDRFEETRLWGKNLYEYLSEVYQTRAFYTVIFVSEAYRDKLWTNVERRAAQVKAFSESKEYILPAVFDARVEIPGVLKSIGYIALKDLSPEDFAEKIILKLRADGLVLIGAGTCSYGPDAKADVDFDLSGNHKIVQLIKELKSHDWYVQRPAMERVLSLDWSDVSADEAFVLGRNINQCACGAERTAMAFLTGLRRELAKVPSLRSIDILNGMFYEVYFDSKGEFRQDNLKSERLSELFAVQTVERYSESIRFIRSALSPYRDSLVVMPSVRPEIVDVRVKVARKDPPVVRSIQCAGEELLIDNPPGARRSPHRMWRLAFSHFGVETLRSSLAEGWYVPREQLKLEITPVLASDLKMTLPNHKTIGWPTTAGRSRSRA